MAILSAMQSAAIRLVGQRPGTFFGSQNTFEMEIADWVNEVAIDIAKYQDWQALTRSAAIPTGAGADFDLPPDYDRMLQSADVDDAANWFWGYTRIVDINEFERIRRSGFVASPGFWALYGNQLHFAPAPAQEATYPYISRNIVTGTDGQPKAQFTADTDEFVLPERLLTLGLVWRWRENKKLDATGDQEAFVKALDEIAAKDKGARFYRKGLRVFRNNISVAYPGYGVA